MPCVHHGAKSASPFTLSGIFIWKLCSDSLGNTEVLGPLDVARNRKSARQVTTEGSVQHLAIGVHAMNLIRTALNIVISAVFYSHDKSNVSWCLSFSV